MKDRIRLAFTLFVALAASAALLLLGGCSTPLSPTAKAADLTGGLLVVRLLGRLDPPPAVQVDVAVPGEGKATAVSGRRQQSVPGQYADYLVSMPLRPERYVLTALRELHPPGAEPTHASPLLVTMTLPFKVTDQGPVYLGRLIVAAEGSNAAAPVEAQDRYDEDTLLFRSAIALLRDVAIANAAIPNELLASAVVGDRPAPTDAAPTRRLTVDSLNADARQALDPSARDAFASFLRLKPPRAFAIGDAGSPAHAFGRGTGAIDRALRDCAQASATRACHLFAVDDMWMRSTPQAR